MSIIDIFEFNGVDIDDELYSEMYDGDTARMRDVRRGGIYSEELPDFDTDRAFDDLEVVDLDGSSQMLPERPSWVAEVSNFDSQVKSDSSLIREELRAAYEAAYRQKTVLELLVSSGMVAAGREMPEMLKGVSPELAEAFPADVAAAVDELRSELKVIEERSACRDILDSHLDRARETMTDAEKASGRVRGAIAADILVNLSEDGRRFALGTDGDEDEIVRALDALSTISRGLADDSRAAYMLAGTANERTRAQFRRQAAQRHPALTADDIAWIESNVSSTRDAIDGPLQGAWEATARQAYTLTALASAGTLGIASRYPEQLSEVSHKLAEGLPTDVATYRDTLDNELADIRLRSDRRKGVERWVTEALESMTVEQKRSGKERGKVAAAIVVRAFETGIRFDRGAAHDIDRDVEHTLGLIAKVSSGIVKDRAVKHMLTGTARRATVERFRRQAA